MKIASSEAHREIERVYRDVGERLWRALYAYSGSRETADEARAEAFAQALGRGHDLHAPERWIWRAAFRIAAGHLKAASEALPAPLGSQEPHEEVGEVSSLLAALRLLSPMQRAALILRYYAGYSSTEVARMLGTSAPAVRVHTTRGRRRLRALLKEGVDG